MGEMTLVPAHTSGYDLARMHTGRFVEYVRGLTEHELGRGVPGLDWTVGEVISHVRSVYERYTMDGRRAATATAVAEQNAADITRLGVDLEEAIVSIEAQIAAMAGFVGAVPPERLFPFHAGQQTTLAGGWGNLLGELLVHGDDISRATGRPFGVPGPDLELTWRFTLPLLQGWLRAEALDLDESWELRFSFGTLWLEIDHGTLQIEPDPTTRTRRYVLDVDDAETFTLSFPYRRRVITDPLVALLASRFRDV